MATQMLFDTASPEEEEEIADPPTVRSREEAKRRARFRAMRTNRPAFVRKVRFRDMPTAYQVAGERPESPVFRARPVDAQLSPLWGSPNWFYPKRRAQKVRAGLYWEKMERVCEETPPPEDTHKAKYARRLWKRNRGVLIALRKYRALGEKPNGKYSWITDLLENDVVSALDGDGSCSYAPREDGKIQLGGDGGTPIAFHVLNFLRVRWDKRLRWGDEDTVSRHARKGGDLTHYSRPGLSSPQSEILRQFQIMRRFQEREKACREALRERFGFDFIEPPSGFYYDKDYPGRKRLLEVL